MRTTAKPVSVFAFAHPSCRISLFRRYRVSEVCHRGGFLLAFAASQNAAAINRRRLRKSLHECERPARERHLLKWCALVVDPSTFAVRSQCLSEEFLNHMNHL